MRHGGWLSAACSSLPLRPNNSVGQPLSLCRHYYHTTNPLHATNAEKDKQPKYKPKTIVSTPPKGSPASSKLGASHHTPTKGSPNSQVKNPPPKATPEPINSKPPPNKPTFKNNVLTPASPPTKIPMPSFSSQTIQKSVSSTVVSSSSSSSATTISTTTTSSSSFVSVSSSSTTIASTISSSSSSSTFLSPNITAASAANAATIHEEVPESLVPDPSKFKIERVMITPTANSDAPVDTVQPKGPKFSVLQYNVLITQIDVVPQYYYCPEYAQGWEYRGPNLVREMRSYNSDIICLQEVDKFDFFKDELARDGYTGIYEPRPYKHLDGLAMFYKKDKFKLIKKHIVNYNKIHVPVKDPNSYYLENRFGFINRGKSKYETNNIALVCELETIESTPRRLFVATTHIYWNPKMPELKVLQSYTLMKELEKIFKLDDKGNPTTRKIPPLVITGDFNSNPDSGMYQLYATKKLARSHADIQSLSLQDLHLHIPVQSAYKDLGEPLTNITKGFVGTLDYIWYNPQLHIHKVLSPITDVIEKYGGMPNLQFSSDHAALMCELEFME